MDLGGTTTFLLVDASQGERVHALLKAQGWLEPHVEPLRADEGQVGFPLVRSSLASTVEGVVAKNLNIHGQTVAVKATKRASVDPHQRLNVATEGWLEATGMEAHLADVVPTKWERLGDLALLPYDHCSSDTWGRLRDHPEAANLWSAMAEALKVSALGVQAPIANDTFRSSQVEMLLGSSEVQFTDHGMTYTFDAAKVMFSSGNVTERRRIGAMNMQGEVVVDAYAGVGYYTFPMLVHAGAAHVHACEINPASLAGLRAGAAANAIEDRLTVHEGDNRKTLANLRAQADRCHLGLLPSSEPVWEACLLALKPKGGVLHVHMNVEEERIEAWTNKTVDRFRNMVEVHQLGFEVEALHLERVKWFAPRVRHVVFDLSLRPSLNPR